MKVNLSTELSAPADRVWGAVATSRLLEYVASPLVRFEPLLPSVLPEAWADGNYEVRMRLFGFVPAGRQLIRISTATDGATRILRDDGSGQLAKTWDHFIRVEPLAENRTRYTDDVEVRAGLLTPFVWAFAQLFYRHRQRRWRALVRRGFRF